MESRPRICKPFSVEHRPSSARAWKQPTAAASAHGGPAWGVTHLGSPSLSELRWCSPSFKGSLTTLQSALFEPTALLSGLRQDRVLLSSWTTPSQCDLGQALKLLCLRALGLKAQRPEDEV